MTSAQTDSELFPTHAAHIRFIATMTGRLTERLNQVNRVRGLVFVFLEKGQFQTGFTAFKDLDLLNLMSFGFAEETAISLLEKLKEYRPEERAYIAVFETHAPGVRTNSVISMALPKRKRPSVPFYEIGQQQA